MSESKLCPMTFNCDVMESCAEKHCAWWLESLTDESKSCCAIAHIGIDARNNVQERIERKLI